MNLIENNFHQRISFLLKMFINGKISAITKLKLKP
jgi:hypothetical protein